LPGVDFFEAGAWDSEEDNPRDWELSTHLGSAEVTQEVTQQVTRLETGYDPIGRVYDCRQSQGVKICKQRVPIGVVGVIYESRPNVTIDIAALCVKAGNVVLLKGGEEAAHSNTALYRLIQRALRTAGLPVTSVQMLDSFDRKVVGELLTANQYVDLVVPRGSSRLINYVRETATVPTIETGAGVCHIYVDRTANLHKSVPVIVNAKVQRPAVCNALDTLLVHASAAKRLLPSLAPQLAAYDVEIYADPISRKILEPVYPKKLLHPAKKSDFGREFLSLAMSIKVVPSLDAALSHIRQYSSKHSESILTETKKNAERFLAEVDAAAVYHNASTRFTDGSVYGMGGEIGISTQKMHARGPMGLEEITTYKWVATGNYNARA